MIVIDSTPRSGYRTERPSTSNWMLKQVHQATRRGLTQVEVAKLKRMYGDDFFSPKRQENDDHRLDTAEAWA